MHTLLLSAALLIPGQTGEPVAMVLTAKGMPTLERDKEASRRLGAMTLLWPGDRVQVPDAGDVTLVFLQEVAEVLRIAHQDAQAVYRDLSGFKITLTPCPDGWHVDYDLTQPLSAGGGPHYVIDPHTGNILARRYEQ